MKIKIDSDVFNIVNRIKEIDANYYILFNFNTKKFELHKLGNVFGTYCLTIPYRQLDARVLKLIHNTKYSKAKDVIKKIDENNEKIQKEQLKKAKEINDYKIREILKSSSIENMSSVFKNNWI